MSCSFLSQYKSVTSILLFVKEVKCWMVINSITVCFLCIVFLGYIVTWISTSFQTPIFQELQETFPHGKTFLQKLKLYIVIWETSVTKTLLIINL